MLESVMQSFDIIPGMAEVGAAENGTDKLEGLETASLPPEMPPTPKYALTPARMR